MTSIKCPFCGVSMDVDISTVENRLVVCNKCWKNIKVITERRSFLDCPLCGQRHDITGQGFKDGDIVECSKCGKEFSFNNLKIYSDKIVKDVLLYELPEQTVNNFDDPTEDKFVLILLNIFKFINIIVWLLFNGILIYEYTDMMFHNDATEITLIVIIGISTFVHGMIHLVLSFFRGLYRNIVRLNYAYNKK